MRDKYLTPRQAAIVAATHASKVGAERERERIVRIIEDYLTPHEARDVLDAIRETDHA